MRLIDWREADSGLLAGIWRDQVSRWSDRLFWDSAGNWADVESHRRSGRLPGLILLDDTRVVGWSFFLVHQETLQVGAFEASSSAATRTLLEAVLGAVEPGLAPAGAMLFSFSAAPDLVPALVARGFETEPYLHLVRGVADAHPPTGSFSWPPAVAAEIPSLLARAYGEPTLTRPFARRGLPGEWREYAAQLLGSQACGQFDPRLSAAHLSARGTLDAAIITTIVSKGTAHVAQVIVDPQLRGQGLALSMLHDVIAKVCAAGFERVSLLVGARNAGAVRLYTRAGFGETASFISAGRGSVVNVTGEDVTEAGDAGEAPNGVARRGYPRRSTSPAFETGGASTFR